MPSNFQYDNASRLRDTADVADDESRHHQRQRPLSRLNAAFRLRQRLRASRASFSSLLKGRKLVEFSASVRAAAMRAACARRLAPNVQRHVAQIRRHCAMLVLRQRRRG